VAKKKKETTKKKVGRNGQRRVSKKKRSTQTYKWIKDIYAKLDMTDERLSEISLLVAITQAETKYRLELIEWFLGGREAMEKVKENSG